MNVRWVYGSGILDGNDGKKYPTFVAQFVVGIDEREVSHVGVLDPDTGKFFPAAMATSPGNLVVRPGEKKTILAIPLFTGRTVRETSFGTIAGDIFVGDRQVQVQGEAWVEVECGEVNHHDSWCWVSVRLDDGRRLMFQDTRREGEAVAMAWGADGEPTGVPLVELRQIRGWKAPTGSEYGTAWRWMGEGEEFLIEAVSEDQWVEDRLFFGVAYWEGFCRVTSGGKVVGHAWVEQVLPGWDVPCEEVALLRQAMMNDEGGFEFCRRLAVISQTADDYADGDASGAKRITDLLAWVAFDLQKDPFYLKHRADLDPLLEMCLLYWEAADEWKLSPQRETRMFGFAYREVMEMAVARAALIVGGRDHARRVIRWYHNLYHVRRGEPFDAWQEAEYGRR